MKNVIGVLLLLLVIGCAKDRSLEATVTGINGQDGTNGRDGRDGVSCSVSQTEAGALLQCSDGSSAIVQNGQNGSNGEDGQDGENGTNGTNGGNVTISNYSSNSCTSILGTSSYTKPTGSNNRGLYSNSSCSSSSKYGEVSQGEAYWINSNTLGTWNNGSLRVLTFN